MSNVAENVREVSIVPQAQPVALTPMDMLARAVQSGAPMEVLEKFMALQERWEANQARKEFDAAISSAKAEIRPITKNKTGHNNKRYADFAAIASAVDPILGRHGLSYRFRTRQDDRIHVTCVLSHKSGHFEETTLSGPADSSGSKNAIQAIGSTLTYLQRYSLMQALGLAAAEDDDGKAAGSGGTISDEQVGEITAILESVRADKSRFLRFFKIEQIGDLPASRFQEAITMLNAKARG